MRGNGVVMELQGLLDHQALPELLELRDHGVEMEIKSLLEAVPGALELRGLRAAMDGLVQQAQRECLDGLVQQAQQEFLDGLGHWRVDRTFTRCPNCLCNVAHNYVKCQ